MKICFLASGGGGNFKFLYLAEKASILKNIELSVIADRECGSVEYAKINNITCNIISYKKNNNKELLKELKSINPDIIITNWHKIIDEEVVNIYKGRMINLHYSLLPAFNGLIGIEPIKKAYEKNCQYVGVTCHYVDEGVDSGKIISQAIVKTHIDINNTIQEVFEKGCLILLNSIILLSNSESLVETKENNKINFSPSLAFDDELFDKDFWKRLK